MSFNKYPYTDFHEMNQDWIITKFQKFYKDFTALNNTVNTKLKEFELKLNLKADKTYVDEQDAALQEHIDLKADKTYVDTSLGKKADKTYVDTELEKKADTEYVNDNFANALKGNASGSVISVDDVSPIQHNVKCKAESKNLFDGRQVKSGNESNWNVIFENNTLTINHLTSYTKGIPNLPLNFKKGKYVITYQSDYMNLIALYSNNIYVNILRNGDSFTIEENNVYELRFGSSAQGSFDLHNIQIEENSTQTPYTPYVDVSNTNVNVCGNKIEFIDNVYPSSVLADRLGVKITALKNYGFHIQAESGHGNVVIPIGYLSNKLNETTTVKGNKNIGSNSNLSLIWQNVGVITDHDITITGEVGDYIYISVKGTEAIDKVIYAIGYSYQKSYTPTTDGTVNGIKSIAPNMTITSDTNGVNIEAEYNRDINKAIAALEGGAQ